MNTNQLPKRLKKEPLIEVLWQAQFETDSALGDVLTGILLAELKRTYPNIQLRRLPTADIPPVITRLDPNLRFEAKIALSVPDSPFVWQVGDQVITLNCRKPYVGWDQFKTSIESLTRIVENTELISLPKRHSLRYIDLLKDELANDLTKLRLTLKLGDQEIKNRVAIRLEILSAQCIHILQIATDTPVRVEQDRLIGTVIDLETLPKEGPNSWDTLRQQLDLLHVSSNELFFRQVLTEETIKKLEPEY